MLPGRAPCVSSHLITRTKRLERSTKRSGPMMIRTRDRVPVGGDFPDHAQFVEAGHAFRVKVDG